MPFVPVKCTSCGGEIQLDNQLKSGFCMHCGSKVIFKEAVQKMELSGSVTVQGIATLEKLLQNAETFQKLGDYEKEKEILTQVTQGYPEDYRAWWRLALQYISVTFSSSWLKKFNFAKGNSNYGNYDNYKIKFNFAQGTQYYDYYDLTRKSINSPLGYIRNAIKLASPKEVLEMKHKAGEWFEVYLQFLQSEKAKLTNPNEIWQKLYELNERAKNAFENPIQSPRNSWWRSDGPPRAVHDISWYIDKELENSTIDKESYDYFFDVFGRAIRDKYGFYESWGSEWRERIISQIDEIINNLLLVLKEFEV